MSGGDLRPSRTLLRARERAAAGLTEAFAGDELDVDEFEARLDRCWRAANFEELEGLFEDLTVSLPVPAEETDEARTGTAPAGGPAEAQGRAPGPDAPRGVPPAPADRPGHDLVLAVMSGVGRGGRWVPPRHINAVAVMGGVELDFREARFPAGETTLHAVALMGGVEIVVPPGLAVTSAGIALMGGYDRLDQEGAGRASEGAVLRIRGVALMGGVQVRVAEPGEELPSGGVAELD